MTQFHLETVAIAAVVIAAMVLEWRRTRDPLHPAFVMGPMLLFLYVFMPVRLDAVDGFFGYLTPSQLDFAQLVNLVGVVGLVAGILVGARGGVYRPGPPPDTGCPPGQLATWAIALGLVGVAGFVAGLVTVGGFEAAYGKSYSGGWSESGYVREFFHLTIPAVLMLTASGELKRSTAARVWLAVFLLPLGVHGVLGARRGPLFMVVVVCVAAWFLVRNLRPSSLKVLGGGALLGTLLLFVFANRNQIFLGSSFDLEASPIDYVQTGREGNEFIYGAGTILTADAADRFSWGGRYAQVFFIRPVPRALWPVKYQVGAELFGVNIQQNMGVDIDLMGTVMGWRGAIGAAPGLVADMWLEFSWGMVLAVFLIGLLYGRAWRACVLRGGRASVTYGVLLCLSVYLVMQTLEAVAFRFLLMMAFTMVAWRFASAGSRHRAPMADRATLAPPGAELPAP